jgi:nitrate/nitrite transport system substrate-binding protein
MRKIPHRHFFSDGLCSCGQRQGDVAVETAVGEAIEQSLLHGLFPDPVLRRTLLKSVGAATVLGALSTLLPLSTLKAIAQEKQPLEKTKLNVGFLPITCAAPLIYGEHLGHYAKQGLDVTLQKIAGINLIRDKMINGRH